MTTDSLSLTFSALADPKRRAILERLSRGVATVSELAKPFGVSLPAISRHLKVLEHAGLIRREKDAQWRRCHLDAEPLRDAARWVEQYRDFWDGQFESLARFLDREDETDTNEEDDNAK